MPAKPVEVISVTPHITLRGVSAEDAYNWAAVRRSVHPGEPVVMLPLCDVQVLVRWLAEARRDLP